MANEDGSDFELGEAPVAAAPAAVVVPSVTPPEPPPEQSAPDDSERNLFKQVQEALQAIAHYPALAELEARNEVDERPDQLYATLVDMQSLREELVQKAGINRALAATLESVAPEALDFTRYPMASFTQNPTPTNLRPALEGLTLQAKAVLVALGAALIAALVKIIHWIIQTIRNIHKRADAAEVVNENIMTFNELAREMMVKGGKPLLDRAEERLTDIETRAAADYKGKHNDLAHDLIFGGNVKKALLDFGARIDTYVSALDSKINSYHNVLRRLIQRAAVGGSDGEQLALVNELKSVSAALPLGSLEGSLKTAMPNYRGDNGLLDYARAFKEHVLTLEGSRTTKQITRDKVMAMVNARRFSFSETYFKDSERTLKAFEALQQRVQGLDHGVDPENFNTQVTNALRHAAMIIRSEANALAVFCTAITTALDSVNGIAGITYRAESAAYQALVNAAIMSDEPVIQNLGRDAKVKLREKMKKK